MADFDMTDVLLDSALCETLTVTRRVETVTSGGFSSITPTTIPIFAVITGAEGNTERSAEGQLQADSITIHSTFRLIGPSIGYQPDVITWRTRKFVVSKVLDFSNMGAGFTSAICEAMDYVDGSP